MSENIILRVIFQYKFSTSKMKNIIYINEKKILFVQDIETLF